MMPVLGFKARVDPLTLCSVTCTWQNPQIHLWCDTLVGDYWHLNRGTRVIVKHPKPLGHRHRFETGWFWQISISEKLEFWKCWHFYHFQINISGIFADFFVIIIMIQFLTKCLFWQIETSGIAHHWRIQGGPNSFIFMQFFGKNVKNNSNFGSWRPPPGKILDPPLLTEPSQIVFNCVKNL